VTFQAKRFLKTSVQEGLQEAGAVSALKSQHYKELISNFKGCLA
jgi:hypothetical protein